MIGYKKLKTLWKINRELIRSLPDDKELAIKLEKDDTPLLCSELIAQYAKMERHDMLVSYTALTASVLHVLLAVHERSLIDALDELTESFRTGMEFEGGKDAVADTIELICQRNEKLFEQGLNKASCSEGDEQNG